MIATIIILVIIIASIVLLCLKSPVVISIASVMSAIIALIVAFNYFELLGSFMITKNYLPDWAHSVAFIVLFAAVMAIICLGCIQIVGVKVLYSDMIKYATAGVCGLLVGIIVSGALLIMLAMSPLSPSIPYARFSSANVKAGNVKPAKSMFVDTFTAGLFSMPSKGSLSSGKSFAVYHPEFIDQLHLNRSKAGGNKGIATYAGKGAVVVPAKIGVRIRSDNRTVVRAGFIGSNISEGGFADKNGKAEFTLSQLRLICKKKDQAADTSGSAVVVYPEQCTIIGKKSTVSGGEQQQKEALSRLVALERNDFKVQRSYGRVAWADLVFSVPSGTQPVILQFKQNAGTDLPKPVNSTEEIEQQLNNIGKKE